MITTLKKASSPKEGQWRRCSHKQTNILMIKYKYNYTDTQTNTNINHNPQEVVLPQGRAVGEMLTSRDGLPYSAFRSILILIVNIFISIMTFLALHSDQLSTKILESYASPSSP